VGSTARGLSIFTSIFKGGLVDPRMRASNEHILIVRVPRAGGRPGCPSHPSQGARSGSKESFSYPCARIRRDEHKNFETLVCVILYTVLFSSRRHRPLPRAEHLFL
jgi:hypothetical protein